MGVVRLVVTAAIAAALPAVVQAPLLRPGRYASTTEMELPGGQKMPTMKQEQCITADDLKDLSKKMLGKGMEGCKVSDYTTDARKITFTAQCTQSGVASSVAAEVAFTSDTYDAVMKMKGPKETLTLKVAAKRTGDCTK